MINAGREKLLSLMSYTVFSYVYMNIYMDNMNYLTGASFFILLFIKPGTLNTLFGLPSILNSNVIPTKISKSNVLFLHAILHIK